MRSHNYISTNNATLIATHYLMISLLRREEEFREQSLPPKSLSHIQDAMQVVSNTEQEGMTIPDGLEYTHTPLFEQMDPVRENVKFKKLRFGCYCAW